MPETRLQATRASYPEGVPQFGQQHTHEFSTFAPWAFDYVCKCGAYMGDVVCNCALCRVVYQHWKCPVHGIQQLPVVVTTAG